MYQYRISLDVYGAEVTVGSVSSDAHAYWSSKNNNSLKSHLITDEEPDVQEKQRLYPWFERDDLIHTYGVEFCGSNRIAVTEESSSDTILECDLDQDWVKDASWVINDKLNQLEQSLLNQDHLNNPIEFLIQLVSLSKYFHLMSDEDRDYVNCAKEALEDQIEWKV